MDGFFKSNFRFFSAGGPLPGAALVAGLSAFLPFRGWVRPASIWAFTSSVPLQTATLINRVSA